MTMTENQKTDILAELSDWAKEVQGFSDILVFGSFFDKTFEPKTSDIDMVFLFDAKADSSSLARFQALHQFKPLRAKLEFLLGKILKRKDFNIIASPLFATPFEFQHDIVKGIDHNFFRHPDLVFYSLLQGKRYNQPFSNSRAEITPPAFGRVIRSILQKVQIRRKEYLQYDAHEDYMGDFKTIVPPDFPKDLARTARLLATGGENPSSDIDFGLQDLIGFVRELKTETALYETLVRHSGRTGIEITIDEQMQLWEVIAQQIVLKVTRPQPIEDPNQASLLDRLAALEERITDNSDAHTQIRSATDEASKYSIEFLEGRGSLKNIQKNINSSVSLKNPQQARKDFMNKLIKLTDPDFRFFVMQYYGNDYTPTHQAQIKTLVNEFILYVESILGPGLSKAIADFDEFLKNH